MCIAMAFTLVFAVACEATVTGITVSSAGNVTEIEVGQTLQLTASVLPENAPQGVDWTSGNTDKATVNNAGLVTAKAAGNVIITAKSTANAEIKKDFALVITPSTPVVDNTPKSITLTTAGNATEVGIGSTLKVNATVSPATASQEVIWATSDAQTATVSNGVVTGVKLGEVTVTATAKNAAAVTKSIKLTVVEGGTTPSTDYGKLPFSTHAEYLEAENGTNLKVKGAVTYIASSGGGSVSYYIQNGQDAYYVFGQDSAQFAVEVGKVYAVGGSKRLYRTGAHEIIDVEYFEALDERITATETSLDDKDVSSQEATMAYHGAVVTGTATVTVTPTTSTKAYSVNVTVNGKDTTLRVDAGNLESSVLTAINAKLSAALAGVTIDFKGVLTHYGNGNFKAPQVLIYSADDITVSEPTPIAKVNIVKDALTVSGFIKADDLSIKLPTVSDAFADVSIAWRSDNAAVIANDGAVTHPEKDTIVTLTATLTHNEDSTATATKEFKVNVAGSTFNAEKLLELDFEDAEEPNQYGQSATKPGYTNKDTGEGVDAANTVTLGGNDWILTGTLISSAAGGDHTGGTFAGRMSAKQGKVETTVAGEYNYVEFDVATYGSQSHGTVVTVMYKMADGNEWLECGMTVVVNSYELSTCRIVLAEGAKNVRICVVSGNGNVNIDNIRLYK